MKIFARSLLSYWLTTFLTIGLGGFLLTSTQLGNDDQTREVPLARLQSCVSTALQNLLGPSATAQNAGPAPTVPCSIRFLAGPDGKRLQGEKLSSETAHMLGRQAPLGDIPLIEVRPDSTVFVFQTLYKHQKYHALVVLPPTRGRFPAFFWMHLASAIAISGFIFWLLARQFSLPIHSLQRVAEGVASGNLSSRPDQSLLERKDELGDLSRSINVMVGRLSELMTSQKSFLAQVSHELGSPLTRLNLALALARRKASPELNPELDRLEHESAELNSMVQQLLLLARLENATEHDHTPHRFSAAQLVREVADDARFEAKQQAKSVSLLYVDKTQWDAIEILGYRELLKRALDNILRNAVRYTAEGGSVEIQCGAAQFRRVRLCIRDYGQGVPSEQMEKIFEPFVQITTNLRPGGAGLGLAIAKQAVLSNGGSVYATNAEPHGLLVTIELPVASEKPPQGASTSAHPDENGSRSLEPAKLPTA